jgi:transposase
LVLNYLPPYSSKLNPIEQVLRTVKRELSAEFIENEEFLVDSFEKVYYKNMDKIKTLTIYRINEL